MEPTTGLEPVTSSLPRTCSTTELRGQIVISNSIQNKTRSSKVRGGAGNGVRTRDPQLGRLMLYQLSYSRTMMVEGGGFEPP